MPLPASTGFYFDTTYMLLMLPAFLLSLIAQFYVRSTLRKYHPLPASRGITADQAARLLLDRNGCQAVRMEIAAGEWTDHFDPRNSVLRLSQTSSGSASVASIGVAAHEAGHAMQHATGYLPNRIRSAIVPVAGLGSTAGPYLALFGIIFHLPILIEIGILLYSAAVLFYLVTLPVEINASRRAIAALAETNLLLPAEIPAAKRVLRAAAWTYVAAALVSFMSLLRLILLSRGNKRR